MVDPHFGGTDGKVEWLFLGLHLGYRRFLLFDHFALAVEAANCANIVRKMLLAAVFASGKLNAIFQFLLSLFLKGGVAHRSA